MRRMTKTSRPPAASSRSMAAALLATGALTALVGAAAAEGAVAEHVRNSGPPLRGEHTLQLEELWRLDLESEALLLGMIGDVAEGPDGNLYLLDRQTAEVHVFSSAGEHLRALSRQGEGPGETRRPRQLLFLADGTLGIVESSPGRIVRLGLDGIPAGEIVPGGEEAAQGMRLLWRAAARGDALVGCTEALQPGQGSFRRVRSLDRLAPDGAILATYLESAQERDMANFKWNEAEDYFVHQGGFALGPDGYVYAAPERDRYRIDVYAPDGERIRTIERADFERVKRTAAEREQADAGMRMVINGREIEKEIADYEPCIYQLRVDSHGRLWVTHSRSVR
ncbi:MAG: hypothetical protein GF330_07255, partial [Candidatus Eisenbacteria bacterium]|nr:hypothetical protein [Candidatus Eisenbacteria bacterium]